MFAPYHTLSLLALLLMYSPAMIAQEHLPIAYYITDWQEYKGEKPYLDQPGIFKLGFYASYGLINPQEINRYIQNDLHQRNFFISDGSSDIENAIVGGIQVHYVITTKLQVIGLVEYGMATSSVNINGSHRYFIYSTSRASAGTGLNYYFIKKTISPYLGAGIVYHYMQFEGFKGQTIAPRAEGGLAFSFTYNFILELFAQYNNPITNGKDSGKELEIDFRTASAGLRLMFRISKSL